MKQNDKTGDIFCMLSFSFFGPICCLFNEVFNFCTALWSSTVILNVLSLYILSWSWSWKLVMIMLDSWSWAESDSSEMTDRWCSLRGLIKWNVIDQAFLLLMSLVLHLDTEWRLQPDDECYSFVCCGQCDKLGMMKGENDFELIRCFFYVHAPKKKKKSNKVMKQRLFTVPILKSESSLKFLSLSGAWRETFCQMSSVWGCRCILWLVISDDQTFCSSSFV